MSNAEDDERSLLEAIRGSVKGSQLEMTYFTSDDIYSYTSFILMNVTTLRLDGCKMGVPSISGEGESESTVAEFNFRTFDFRHICNILKEIERASSAKLDEHKFALSLPRIRPLDVEGGSYILQFILEGPLAAFAVTHGVWLLVLKFVCTNSGEEDIVMVLKRVERLFITLRRNQGMGETEYHLDFYIYISLLSSSITRMPKDNWKSMDSLYSLIKAMFDVVSVIHLFVKNVVDFIPKFLTDKFDNLLLLSMYWVIRGVVACTSQCKELPKNRYVIQDSGKLTDICDKLISIHERLQKLDSVAKQYMDDEKFTNAYEIPDKKGQDNYFALMSLFGLQPDGSEDVKLSHCSKKNTDLSMVTVRRKTLVLLISGLDISSNVISFLKDIYVEYMTSLDEAHCEFIWLPIHSGPWITSSEEQYTKLLETMLWYTVHPPTFLTEESKRFIRDVWMFHRKPIAVVLNENGKVVCPNAMHLLYIWRDKAFPFTRMRERTLWAAETRLSSIVLDFDTKISSMVEDSKWPIVLYGGYDVEWIRKFITCIRKISVDSGTSIEMIYVGKNAASENIREVISSMCVDMPQIYSPDSKKIWYFWKRLESLLISRYQMFGEAHHTIDPIIKEVKKFLSYASTESWACLITPSSDMIIHDLGDTMLQGFMEFKLWKQHLHSKDFSKIFLNHIEQLRQSQVSDRSCSRIVLNIDNKDVVQSLECPHCNHFMEKKVQYRCCHTDADELQ
ncbi:hypothetical protein QQ045_016932 [Rhodiola kirilowii]